MPDKPRTTRTSIEFSDERTVCRFEDMSPFGRLSVHRQNDGDIILTGIMDDGRHASVEFCMPMTGGGQSEHTFKALQDLIVAMRKDNELRPQVRGGE